MKGASGGSHDSCGYHYYVIRKQGAARATELDPEVIIDEGMVGP